MPINHPDETIDGYGQRMIGCGTLLVRSDASCLLRVGTYSEPLFEADCGEEGSYRTYAMVGAALTLCLYGAPPPQEPGWLRSFVKLSLYPDTLSSTVIMTVAAMHDLYLTLRFAPGIRKEVFSRYAREIEDLPCLKLITPAGRSVYLIAEGAWDYEEETSLLHLHSGYTRIMMALSDERTDFTVFRRIFRTVHATNPDYHAPGNSLYKRACRKRKQDKTRYSYAPLYPLSIRRLVDRLRDALFASQAAEGGFAVGEGKPTLADMCRVAMFLLTDLNRRAADDFCGFLLSLFLVHGRVPHRCYADGQGTEYQENVPDRDGEAAVFFLAAYCEAFGIAPTESMIALAKQVLSHQSRLIKQGMMPPYAEAAEVLEGSVSRFDGSAEETLRFLRFVPIALSLCGSRLSPQERMKQAVLLDFVAKRFDDHFLDGRVLYANQPSRSLSIRYPHRISGYCDACRQADTLTLLARGSYWCPRCLEKREAPKPIPGKRCEPYKAAPPLTVLASALGFAVDPLPLDKSKPEDLSLWLSMAAYDSKEASRLARRLTMLLTQHFAAYSLPSLCAMTQTLFDYATVKRLRRSAKGE